MDWVRVIFIILYCVFTYYEKYKINFWNNYYFDAIANTTDSLATDITLLVQTPTKAQEVERLVDKYGVKIVEGFNTLV